MLRSLLLRMMGAVITRAPVTVRSGSVADSSSTQPSPISVPVCDSCRRADGSVERFVLTVNSRVGTRRHSTRGAGVLLLCGECKVGERCDICGMVEELPMRPVKRFNRLQSIDGRSVSRGGVRLCGKCWSETAKTRMRPMKRRQAPVAA